MLRSYPVTEKEFNFVKSSILFYEFDESGMAGFFTLRNLGNSLDELCSEFITEGTKEGEWIGIKPTYKRLFFTGVEEEIEM